jgi:biopolymer transport protein ExbD
LIGPENAMRLPQQTYKRARIEIIPMIDTVFFLLVFFMIASLAMTAQTGFPVNLPRAASGVRESRASVTITLTSNHQLYVDKQPVTLGTLGPLLKSKLEENPRAYVVINADKRVRHGEVIAVMDEAKKHAAHMAIATEAIAEGVR